VKAADTKPRKIENAVTTVGQCPTIETTKEIPIPRPTPYHPTRAGHGKRLDEELQEGVPSASSDCHTQPDLLVRSITDTIMMHDADSTDDERNHGEEERLGLHRSLPDLLYVGYVADFEIIRVGWSEVR
jgi:predicted HAD superfamily Cof-like phosphohydrolase